MLTLKDVARKRLLANKAETAFVIAVVSVVMATLIIAFSASIGYLQFFLAQAEALTGEEFSTVINNGISNIKEIGEYMAEFTLYFLEYTLPSSFEEIVPPPSANNSDSLFSPLALVENLPLTIILMLIILILISYLSLSIVFSACKRERRKFFSVLLATGATDRQIKKCAFYESVYYFLIALPIGLLFSVLGICIVKLTVTEVFEKLNHIYSGLEFSVRFGFSFVAFVITMVFVFFSVCRFSGKTYKKLSVKYTAKQIRESAGTDIGLCTFTANAGAYQRRGIEYYVAIRNFQNNFSKYFKVIFMTIVYSMIAGMTFLIFNVIRNYNNQEVLLYSKEMLSFTFSFQLYFGLIALSLCAICVVSTFVAVFTNINSNVGEYAVMVSSGSSLKTVLKTVSKEGVICSVSGMMFSLLSIVYTLAFVMEIYSADSDMNFVGLDSVAGIVAVSLLLFFTNVMSTVAIVKARMKNLETVKVLKDYFY